MRCRHCLHALIISLAFGLAPLDAAGADIPNIGGHVTDPLHKLSASDKSALEEKLGKIQQDTHIDVAAWITDAPPGSLNQLGNEAYKRWNIGGEWDNGVFFVVPSSGVARVIMNRARPELSASEEARIVAADSPSLNMVRRIELLADGAGAIIRSKILQPRPPGKGDPRRGLIYAIAAAAIAIAAVVLSITRRSGRSPPREPTGSVRQPPLA